VREQVFGLANRGHEVIVIARSIGEGISPSELLEIDSSGVSRIYTGDWSSRPLTWLSAKMRALRNPGLHSYLFARPPWPLNQRLVALATVEEIARWHPDVVHVHFGTLAAKIVNAAEYLERFPPVVTTWHGYDATAMPRQLGADIYKDLFSSRALHTVGSQFMRDRVASLGARSSSLTLIPMGIDLRRFRYRPPSVPSSNHLKVVSVGRLDEMKGHSYLIQACALLRRQGKPLTLRIIGDGPLRSTLEQLVSDLGISDTVRLLGSLPADDVARELESADIFALTGIEAKTGKVEAQGVVFAEAQAVGLPIIASNIGGVPDSILPQESGILTPPGDSPSIAKALEYFIDNPEKLKDFGQKGRQFVEKHFTIDSMLSDLENVLAHAIETA